MIGTGTYRWRGIDGEFHEATHWDDLPVEMQYLIAFEPDALPEPHTEEEHAAMATFNDRLQEALKRCRQ